MRKVPSSKFDEGPKAFPKAECIGRRKHLSIIGAPYTTTLAVFRP